MAPESSARRPLRPLLLLGIGVLLLLILSFLLLPLGGGQGDHDPVVVGGHPLYGEPAPGMDLLTLDGERVTLASLEGRPVLVNFWASWCGPCREEFPLMVEAYAEHADKGLEILGVVHHDAADRAAAFAQEQGATWPLLLDPDDEAWEAYRGVGLPTSFFVDADGVVRAFSLGGFTEDGLQAQLARILPEA